MVLVREHRASQGWNCTTHSFKAFPAIDIDSLMLVEQCHCFSSRTSVIGIVGSSFRSDNAPPRRSPSSVV